MFDVIKTFELRLANAEAQRKKDLDNAEAQIETVKKDLDKTEAQRNDLKDQIELLKREAAITMNEIDVLKENAAGTERYIETLVEDMEATTDFLALGVRLFSSLSLFLLHPHNQGRGQSGSNQT